MALLAVYGPPEAWYGGIEVKCRCTGALVGLEYEITEGGRWSIGGGFAIFSPAAAEGVVVVFVFKLVVVVVAGVVVA